MEWIFDADGRPGQHAQDGGAGFDGGRGRDGGRGGDASRSHLGEPGGENMVVLLSGASDEALHWNQIAVSGYCNPVGAPRKPIQATISMSDLDGVRVRACGGRGGDGSDGGPGGDGGRGRRGRDATRHSSGGSGGPGGDGGDGGRGTHGADGGRGGVSRLHIDGRDLYLLTAVEQCEAPAPLVRGGGGGGRGHHGPGGGGGRGGAGGSSYSWTEYETDTEWYTDANGNRQTRSVQRAVRHSNSGGWRGPSGTRGWTPTDPLYDGRDGAAGAFVITVTDAEGGRKDYGRRFDLELVDFELVEDPGEEVDGVAEFGEVIHAARIRLRNTGPMPSPQHQRVRLWLSQGPWTVPLGDELYVEQVIEPGQEVLLEGSLRFRIREVEITEPGDPFVARQPVRLRVVQLGPEREGFEGAAALFQRDYTARRVERILSAQYPVENRGGVIALRSLAGGERTRLSFDVANISNSGIGESSDRRRKVAVQLELLGGMESEDVLFVDGAGVEIDLGGQMEGFDGYFVRIPLIEARSHVKIQGQFGFREDLPPYAGADVRMTIWLEDLHDPSIWRIAQRRQITIRVEPDYVYRPESKVLLVSNDTTTQDAFMAWKRLLEDVLGLGADFWSVSRYGHFDHRADLTDGTDLRTHLEDRVALVLNQPFHLRASDQTDLPTDYLKGKDFREGATSNNTHFAVIGSSDFSMRQLLEPTSDVRRGGDDYPDEGRFLQKEALTGGPLTQEIFKEDITTLYDVVESHNWTFWGLPGVGELEKSAVKLQSALTQMHPNRRYVLVVRPKEAPEREGRSWLLFPRWSLGQIEVRRTLNTETSAGLVLQVHGEQLQNPRFILGSLEVRFAVLLSLPFEDKLDRLNWLLATEPDTLDAARALTMRALVLALLVDLSEEQSALRSGKGTLTGPILAEKLSNLGRLLKTPLHTQIDAGSDKWDHLIELCAGLEAMAEAHLRWWRFWGRDRKISSYVVGQIKGLVSQLFDRYALDPTGDVAVDGQSAGEKINARAEVMSVAFGASGGRGAVAHHHFEHPPELSQGVSRDIDVWRDPSSRIWSAAELARAQSEEAAREAKQAELREINTRIRAEMLTEAVSTSEPEAAVESEVSEEVQAVSS